MTSPTRDVFQLELEKRNVVQAEIDPLTGGIGFSGIFDAPAVARTKYGIPSVLNRPNKQMASAPTVTTSTVGTQIASARVIPIRGNGDSSFPYNTNGIDPTAFSLVSFAGNAQDAGNVTTNAAGTTFQTQSYRYAIDFDGTEIEFQNRSAGGKYWIKINDEYIDPVGVTLAADAVTRYIKVTFGARTRCRVEFVSYYLSLSNIRVDPTAGVAPAQIRGPRCIMIGDSFNGTPKSYPRIVGDMLGWDDVWNSGMGGTGFVADNGIRTFGQRLDHDVIQYAPKVAWFCGSVNDDGAPPATVAAAVLDVQQRFHASLPDSLFIWSPNAAGGAAKWSINKNQIRAAVKAALAGKTNVLVCDVLEMPLVTATSIPGSVLADSVSVGATSINVIGTWAQGGYPAPGAVIKIDDERLEVKSAAFGGTSGGDYKFTVQIDGTVQQAHAAGASWSIVGASYISGSGKVGATTGYGSADVYVSSDGLHPTDAGQIAYGAALAQSLQSAVSAL